MLEVTDNNGRFKEVNETREFKTQNLNEKERSHLKTIVETWQAEQVKRAKQPTPVKSVKRVDSSEQKLAQIALDLRSRLRPKREERATKALIDFATNAVKNFLLEEHTGAEMNRFLIDINPRVIEAAADFIKLRDAQKKGLLDATKDTLATLNQRVLREVQLRPASAPKTVKTAEQGSNTEFRRRVLKEMKDTEASFADAKEGFRPLHTLINSKGYKQNRDALVEMAGVSRSHLQQVEEAIERTHAAIAAFNTKVQAIDIPEDEKDDEGVERAVGQMAALIQTKEAALYFHALADFAALMSRANAVLEAMQQTGKLDNQWFGEITDISESKVKIDNRTIKPAQRLPRWELMWKDLTKKLGHKIEVNRAALAAVREVEDAATVMNDQLLVIEDFGKLNSLGQR